MKSLAILSFGLAACGGVEFTTALDTGPVTDGGTSEESSTIETTSAAVESDTSDAGHPAPTASEEDAAQPAPEEWRDPLIESAEGDGDAEWFVEGATSSQVGFVKAPWGSSVRAHTSGAKGKDVVLLATYFDDPAGISNFDGVAFWICGRGTFWFEVPTDSTVALEETGEHNHFARELTLDGRWTFVEVPWSDLGQGRPTHPFDVETVRGLFFTVVGRDLEVWLDNVQFFGADVPRFIWLAPTGGC